MQISELARKHDISASAIRYYERRGLLPDVQRSNGIRVFSAADDLRISFIQLAQRAGFTIAEINKLLDGFGRGAPSARWRANVDSKRKEILAAITSHQKILGVLDHVLACECPTLEDCATRYQQTKS